MKNHWNDRYAEKGFAYGSLPNEFFKQKIDELQAGKILCVCEGEGRNAVYAAQNNWIVDAFDLSEEGFKKATMLAEENHVHIHYQIGDAETIEYAHESFDAIALIYAHFPVSIRKKIHQRIIKWLKPNGILILEAFNPNQLQNSSGGPKELSMLYTKEILADDFESLQIEELDFHPIQLNEGKYHIGKADVIRFFGKK